MDTELKMEIVRRLSEIINLLLKDNGTYANLPAQPKAQTGDEEIHLET